MEYDFWLSWVLLVIFFVAIFYYFAQQTTLHEPFEDSITKKDKIPTCSEAAVAYNTVIRYIASDITGDGNILLKNFRDTFLEVDDECYKSKKCPAIQIKKEFDTDTLYNNWANPLKCQR